MATKHRRKSKSRRKARSSKSRSGRKWGARGMRRARKTQSRRGLRMSTRGFYKAKRKGRTKAHKRTFMRLRRKARNPVSRTTGDGTTVELDQVGTFGVLRVHHPDGGMSDYKLPWLKALDRFRKFKSGKKIRRKVESEDWAMLAADNPRSRRRGKSRRARGSRHWSKVRKGTKSEWAMLARDNCNPAKGRWRGRPYSGFKSWKMEDIGAWARDANRARKKRKSRSRSARNPAQFPMPFASAMNPRISKRDAASMKRVLRRHGRRCR
jgi:hypothetical protein